MKRKHLFVFVAALVSAAALADESPQAQQAGKESLAAAERAKLVTSVQAQLGVPPSGQMDRETHAKLKEFQAAKGLEPTGQLDKPTLAKLGMTGPHAATGGSAPAAAEKGKPSTPVGTRQPSEERAAKPKITHDQPTGEK
jgi:putative peptidoglycan binding protein